MTYLLNINSPYLQKEEINKIISESDNVVKFSMDDYKVDDVITECGYSSFIDTNKAIIVNDFQFIEENNKILKYLDNQNNDVTLIINCKNLDKRNNLFKAMKDKVTFIEIKELTPNEKNTIILNYCKKNNIKIDYLSINYLLENNMNDIDLVILEINKISTISKNINMEVINKYASLIIPDETFSLCDAIVEKKTKKIKDLLDDFIATKKEVIPFNSLLAMQYRYIYAVKITSKSPASLVKLFDVKSDYPFKKASTRQNMYSIKELENILIMIAETDIKLKSGIYDDYSILKNLITNIL